MISVIYLDYFLLFHLVINTVQIILFESLKVLLSRASLSAVYQCWLLIKAVQIHQKTKKQTLNYIAILFCFSDSLCNSVHVPPRYCRSISFGTCTAACKSPHEVQSCTLSLPLSAITVIVLPHLHQYLTFVLKPSKACLLSSLHSSHWLLMTQTGDRYIFSLY